jgi:hypothetical protein
MAVQLSKRGYCVPTSLLEIIDLGDGNIVLQRADDNSEPLVSITFSSEARMYILDQGLEVAKAMIQAGIQAAAQLAEQTEVKIETEVDAESDSEPAQNTSRVLH